MIARTDKPRTDKQSHLSAKEVAHILGHLESSLLPSSPESSIQLSSPESSILRGSHDNPEITLESLRDSGNNENFTIKNLSGGSSRGTFLLSIEGKKYIISIFRKRVREPLRTNNPVNSHNFQKFLFDNNMPVPNLIGQPGFLDETGKFFQIQEFIEGTQPDIPTAKQMEILGSTLAKMHQISMDYMSPPPESRSDYRTIHKNKSQDSPIISKENSGNDNYKLPFKSRIHNIGRLILDTMLPSRLAHISHETFTQCFIDLMKGKSPSPLPTAMIHGGVRSPNLIFKNDAVFFIDFEGAHYTSLWRDIVRPLGSMCCRIEKNTKGEKIFILDEKLILAFLKSYHLQRNLTPDEIIMLPSKTLLFAERSIKHDAANVELSLSEKIAKLNTTEEALKQIDFFKLLDVKKPVAYLGFRGASNMSLLGIRFILTALYARIANSLGFTTLRQLKDESLEWSNKFDHPITWDPYMKGGKGGFNRRGRDDARDAFRHCYAGAVSTYELGSWLSTMLGDIRKIISRQNKEAVKMDIYNNKIGRAIGKELRKIAKLPDSFPSSPESPDSRGISSNSPEITLEFYEKNSGNDERKKSRQEIKQEIANKSHHAFLEGKFIILNKDVEGR